MEEMKMRDYFIVVWDCGMIRI